MVRRRHLLDPIAAGLVALLIFAFFGRAFLNYDTFYSLLWGGDLANGRTPDYRVPFAPTPIRWRCWWASRRRCSGTRARA